MVINIHNQLEPSVFVRRYLNYTNNVAPTAYHLLENIVWDMSGNIPAADEGFDYGGHTIGRSPSNIGFLGTHFAYAKCCNSINYEEIKI